MFRRRATNHTKREAGSERELPLTSKRAVTSQAHIEPWNHRKASSATCEASRLRQVNWDQIQAWCNFVVFRPRILPSNLVVESLSLRPEAPPGRDGDMRGRPSWHDHNRCSLRFEIVGTGRGLRVKQFLYDWAPPAFDHPCLWKSHNEPFEVGKNIGWLGTDYRKRRGASVNIDRTTIELSTYEGTFAEDELQTICRGMRPVDIEARERILATPVATLCYQSRHREQVIDVPCGYFAHQRRPSTMEVAVYNERNVPSDLPGREVVATNTCGFCLDTAFVYGAHDAPPQEVDYLFETDNPPSGYLRLLVSSSNQPGGVLFPPRVDLQPCTTRLLNVCGREVHHAFLTERYGPHEAVWQANSQNFMLLTKPSPETDSNWFGRLLKQMLAR